MSLFGKKEVDLTVGPLAEFNALRAEIIALLDLTWKVHALQLSSAGAIFTFSLSSAGRVPTLLIIPISSYLLLMRLALYRENVKIIGEYIEHTLDKRIPGGLGWEAWLRTYRGQQNLRQVVTRQPAMIAYFGTSALALVAVAIWFFDFGITHLSSKLWLLIVFATGWAIGLTLSVETIRMMVGSFKIFYQTKAQSKAR